MTQANPDESCAVTITFDENGVNFINIGTYLDGTCHLPEWDFMGSPLVVQGSDYNVTADGPLHNCAQVVVESASNVSVSGADFDGVFGGVGVYGGSNITLHDLSFQGTLDFLDRALDVSSSQGVTASQLSFTGNFDRVNIASSSGVSVAKSSFELRDDAFTVVNIFESSDVAVSQVKANGGQGLMSAFNANGVTLDKAAVTLSADGFSANVAVFDSSDVSVTNSTIDRRAIAASSLCFNLNDSSDITVSNNKCLADPATSSGGAMTITIVKNYLVANNLFEGNAGGIFVSSDGVIPDNGEISRNTINMTGPYGLFLSAVTDVDVIRNNITNTLGTGQTGTWYYDELTDGTPLFINFEKNKYSGFALNGECNSLDTICP
ncbi:MAG TPA: right-handed parallel beta-helix repeat-containing protein [bacterium]|nr:right-handed parallel beta-helix repeat-containing protein [bacterium]